LEVLSEESISACRRAAEKSEEIIFNERKLSKIILEIAFPKICAEVVIF